MTDTTDLNDDISGNEAGDDVIELTDIVTDDDIIELTDIAASEEETMEPISVEEDESAEDEIELEDEINLVSPDEPQTILTLDEDDDFELEIEASKAPVQPDAVADIPADTQISMEQVQAALESVIEKKFADKIESILYDVMEKVLEKELGAIKETLLKDLDQIGNP